MTFTQLNPTIPLRSDKASGECIAVIDYSIEHDLMWIIIDDTTGQVWTVPNKDVRAYANYSAGRNLKPAHTTETVEQSCGNVFADIGLPNANELLEKADAIIRNMQTEPPAYDAAATLDAFAAQWIAQPGATKRLLDTCLTADQVLRVLQMIAKDPVGLAEGAPDWMPDFMGEAKP